MCESGQVQPGQVRVVPAQLFCRLIGVHAVGQVDVWVALVHQFVQPVQGAEDVGAEGVEARPASGSAAHRLHSLLVVHLLVGAEYAHLELILSGQSVVPELRHFLSSKLFNVRLLQGRCLGQRWTLLI